MSVNAGNKNTQHAPSTKTECDYLNGWIKNLTQKWYSWGTQKRKKKEEEEKKKKGLGILIHL